MITGETTTPGEGTPPSSSPQHSHGGQVQKQGNTGVIADEAQGNTRDAAITIPPGNPPSRQAREAHKVTMG